MKAKRRIWQFVTSIALIVIMPAAGLVVLGLMAKPQPSDIAIVFGNTVERNGKPSARLRARLESARGLFISGVVRMILVSGGLGKEGFNEAEVMKKYLVAGGVPVEAVYVAGEGINTSRTCANARATMESTGLRSAIVVSQYFHVPRAKLACQRVGIRVVGASYPTYFELRDLYSIVREAVAYPVYAFAKR